MGGVKTCVESYSSRCLGSRGFSHAGQVKVLRPDEQNHRPLLDVRGFGTANNSVCKISCYGNFKGARLGRRGR